MLGRGWFLHAGSLDCLTFQFADKPAAHLPDPATINGHSMIAQHQSKRAQIVLSPHGSRTAAYCHDLSQRSSIGYLEAK